MTIEYYEPEPIGIDLVLYELAKWDITKAAVIEELPVDYCYDWYYLNKVRELNEMKVRIAEWRKIKEK